MEQIMLYLVQKITAKPCTDLMSFQNILHLKKKKKKKTNSEIAVKYIHI